MLYLNRAFFRFHFFYLVWQPSLYLVMFNKIHCLIQNIINLLFVLLLFFLVSVSQSSNALLFHFLDFVLESIDVQGHLAFPQLLLFLLFLALEVFYKSQFFQNSSINFSMHFLLML